MTAGKHNFYMEQGATWAEEVIIKDVNGDPINLTGYTACMQVRLTYGSTIIISMSTANGRITITPLTGTLSILVSAADTTTLAPGVYKYDLEITSGAYISRVLEGKFTISAEVTTTCPT